MTSDRTRITPEEAALFRTILSKRAPGLLHIVSTIEEGHVVSDEDANAAEDVLVQTMLQDEYTAEEGLSSGGNAIDDLIALCKQYAASFETPSGGRPGS